jgi:hypothetical protein
MTGSVGQFGLEAPRAGSVLAHTFRHHSCVVETRYWRGIAKEGIALSSIFTVTVLEAMWPREHDPKSNRPYAHKRVARGLPSRYRCAAMHWRR